MDRESGRVFDSKRRGRLFVGILGLVLAAGYTYMGSKLPMGRPAQPGAGVFPLVVGVAMAVSSLMLILEQVAKGAGKGDTRLEFPRGMDLWRVVGCGMSIAVYTLLSDYLGNLVASFALALGLVHLIDPRRWKRTIVTAAGIALAAHVLFVLIFGITLPEGTLLR